MFEYFTKPVYYKDEIRRIADKPFGLVDKVIEQSIESLKIQQNQNASNVSNLNEEAKKSIREEPFIPTEKENEASYTEERINVDDYWIKEQLKSLAEIKVMYLFKTTETTIRALTEYSYPKKNTKGLYKWDNFISFYKIQNIEVEKIEGYNEVDELRNVANNLKHNEVLYHKIKNINEFIDDDDFTYENITTFYERVKEIPQNFVSKLAEAIINEIYFFNDEKIKKIANGFKTRMDNDSLLKLSKELIKK